VEESFPHLFAVRLSGDVSTKARWTHARFARRLCENARDALAAEGIDGRVRSTHDRIFVEAARPEAGAVLARVFGVQSCSEVTALPAPELADLVAAAEAFFRERVRGRRFAVRARRVGERARIAIEPRALERELGAALLPTSAGVDLEEPEVTAGIELIEDRAYLFDERVPGPAGLPLGVEGRGLALVSGGFDSPVAAWHLLKRGVALHYLFCNLGGATHQLGVLRVMKVIADRWSYGSRPKLHALDFAPVADELRERTERRYWQVLLKRQMLRAAEAVARDVHAEALVTGEAVGQVSSQTLANLAVISSATALPILRPLVGFNKEEILADAVRIGTFDLSAVVGEYCAMVPRKPATAAAREAVEAEEASLDPALLARVVAERAVLDLRSLDPEKLGIPELEIDAVPEGATVIDLRSRAAYDGWHWPGALYLDFPHALAAWPRFDRARPYVLYCEFGLKSAHLAEQMRQGGFEAWNFRGGFRALARHARERGLASPADFGPVAL
jgi:thiamine biosynthesis protein ThiI